MLCVATCAGWQAATSSCSGVAPPLKDITEAFTFQEKIAFDWFLSFPILRAGGSGGFPTSSMRFDVCTLVTCHGVVLVSLDQVCVCFVRALLPRFAFIESVQSEAVVYYTRVLQRWTSKTTGERVNGCTAAYAMHWFAKVDASATLRKSFFRTSSRK